VGLFGGYLPELVQAPMSWELRHGAILERYEDSLSRLLFVHSLTEPRKVPARSWQQRTSTWDSASQNPSAFHSSRL
jgi:hypothetical protein